MSTRTLAERAARLIKAATGEEYGDYDIVSDLVVGYAEPGYGSDESVIVLGNWNDKTKYVQGIVGGRPTRHAPITTSNIPTRLGNALERIGVELEWSDEWTTCGECYRALRTQGDSYGWTMFGAFTGDGYTCQDCMKADPNAYLTDTGYGNEEYINNSRNAVTWLTGAELKAIGFTQWAPNDPQSYENGWHPGQTDDPKEILKEITETGEWAETVFLIDSVGQFDIRFSAWVRNPDGEASEDSE